MMTSDPRSTSRSSLREAAGRLPSPRKAILFTVVLALLTLTGFLVTQYYSFIFSREVVGEIVAVDRLLQPNTVIGMGSAMPNPQMFSVAIAIKIESGEIITASSEDRQWAVVEKGQCAEARFYPYPPWKLDKSGTYFGARLMKLHDCVRAD